MQENNVNNNSNIILNLNNSILYYFEENDTNCFIISKNNKEKKQFKNFVSKDQNINKEEKHLLNIGYIVYHKFKDSILLKLKASIPKEQYKKVLSLFYYNLRKQYSYYFEKRYDQYGIKADKYDQKIVLDMINLLEQIKESEYNSLIQF